MVFNQSVISLARLQVCFIQILLVRQLSLYLPLPAKKIINPGSGWIF